MQPQSSCYQMCISLFCNLERIEKVLFYLLLQLLVLLFTFATSSSRSSQNGTDVLRFGVFILKDSSNSFEYAGFQPSLELGFETVNDLAVLRRADSRKYQITYNGK